MTRIIGLAGTSFLALALAPITAGAAQPPAGAAAEGREFWIDGPAGALRVNDGGTGGMPVVFVHSLAGTKYQWTAQLFHLRNERRAIAFDLRGHGDSKPATDGDYSLSAMAADLAAVVAELDIPRFVLVGHSMGGGVIAKYAGLHPDRVAALVFVDPIGDQRAVRDQLEMFVQMLAPETYDQWIQTFYESILVSAQAQVRVQVLEELKATPRETVVGAYEGMVTYDPVATLAPFDGPMVTIISPLNNFPFSLHNLMPDLERRLMTGVSHWLQMDKPFEFNGYVDEFLKRVR